MKQNRKFLRQCVFCREYKSKEDLIRITKTKEGFVEINNAGDVQGRSVYICKNAECIKNALKKKKIEGSLKSNLPESIKEELSTVLKN
ncbi:MAG: YlxR family protein [Candidatus Gastranaerophilales bacterium]|nr:YlxR family protein [Candidatus Gastranaerophilales bacterium]